MVGALDIYLPKRRRHYGKRTATTRKPSSNHPPNFLSQLDVRPWAIIRTTYHP
ncbi:hypothetical protein BDW75DRAFT_205727 [Aspergillus navahoensis]